MEKDVFERYRRLPDLDRSFDLKFWQSRPDAEKFVAAWELVVHSYLLKGKDVSELRLQRSVERFREL